MDTQKEIADLKAANNLLQSKIWKLEDEVRLLENEILDLEYEVGGLEYEIKELNEPGEPYTSEVRLFKD